MLHHSDLKVKGLSFHSSMVPKSTDFEVLHVLSELKNVQLTWCATPDN